MSYKSLIKKNQIVITSFQERLNNFIETQHMFNKVNKKNCLVSIKKNENEYEYHIQDGIIILKERIGSNSKYGIIYLTTNEINKKIFATKITLINDYNYLEILLAQQLSDISSKNLSPHFIFIYKILYCYNNFKDENIPKLIKKNNYYISINEFLNGTFKNFLELKLSYEYIFNAFQQIMIAILSFHYFTGGMYHNDCHYNNFLFLKIKPGGYFHYKLFNNNYYVKNMGYLWFIWDFGLISAEPYYKNQRIKDYFRIIYFFNLDLPILKRIKNIINYIQSYEKDYEYNFGSSDKIFFEKFIFDNKILLTKFPKSSKIINKIPYIINDF